MAEPDVPPGARLISRRREMVIYRWKPAAGGGRYQAFDPATGAPLSSPQGSMDQAVTQAEIRLRRAARKRRPCLKCGAQFLSDGAHHRMCCACRGLSAGPFDCATGDARFSEMRTIPR